MNEMRTAEVVEYQRFGTGNDEADEILGGGFLTNSINIIMGQPGTGKTIFAEQVAFHNADERRPILYLTTLSEPLGKIVRYLQGFRFFDESKVGTAVVYEDIGAELIAGGPDILVPHLKAAIKAMSPKAVFIDSFRAIHDLTPDISANRGLLYDLAGLLSAYDTTAIFVGEYSDGDIARFPEFAIADGIVEFSRRRLGGHDERHFRVLKLRGSGYREGSHAITIDDRGVRFFPRLVTPTLPERYDPIEERVSTGVPDLDTMMGGGLWRGSSTLYAGPSGSGKTTLALHFAIEGARRGEPTLYANFQENPIQLRRTLRGMGVDPEALEANGLAFFYTSPVELQIDSIIVELFRRIARDGIRRIVIDAVGDLAASAEYAQRLNDYLYALNQHLAVNTVTSIFTLETPTADGVAVSLNYGPISSIADNIVRLQLDGDEHIRRTVRIIKTRRSPLDPRVREMEISSDGITIA
jgi:circadian clock protein KaiC